MRLASSLPHVRLIVYPMACALRSPVLVDNYPQPGKRPLSSIVPTIVEDEQGRFITALGASGGSKIFPSVFQVLANLDWGMDASHAIEFGRLHDQLYPMSVEVDNIYPPDIIDDLKRRGHNITSGYPGVRSTEQVAYEQLWRSCGH